MNEYVKIDGVDIHTATPVESLKANILKNNSRGHSEVQDLNEWRKGMPIAIVGGGPSLADTLDELRKYKYIMACGSVYDYLVENNIIPTWCVVCDADPVVNKYLTKKDIDTKFLVASQCSEETFEFLHDKFVYIWHASGTNMEENTFGGDKILIGGGCTVGTRAMALALGFGYTNLQLFGFDTCVENNKHHAYDFQTEEETVGDIIPVKVEETGKEYLVARYMLAQIFDFKQMCETYSFEINVHGRGILKDLVEDAVKRYNEEK